MPGQATYPQFLSNQPSGKDEFKGQSQKKIASKIASLIKNNALENKRIIGLEGDWGSGKSNVVRMIQDQLASDNYHTFIYDAWGFQEDLTRRSFLEQIIQELINKKVLENQEEWRRERNKLLAKTSTSHTQKFPKIKFFWIIFSLAIISYGFLSSFYKLALEKRNVIPSWDAGIYKPIIVVYSIPCLFFIWGLYLLKKAYSEEKKKNPHEKFEDRISRIIYWLQGKDIESEEVENILEEEPSVIRFREYLKKIEDSAHGSNYKIIIVFDNLDRLEKDKIKSLWSSIHSFFAESDFKSWVIIPYNKSELLLHLNQDKNDITSGQGFIDKSISINFRITPPVITEWESFLNTKINEAFGSNIIPETELEYIKRLFDIFTGGETIKPRKIINYMNNLVSLYVQWEDTIRFRYLALYSFVQDGINNDPYSTIPSRSYFKDGQQILFDDLEELDQSIAALTFGVEKDLANDVLLSRQLSHGFETGDLSIFNNLKNHSAFNSHFLKIFKSNIRRDLFNIPKILHSLGSTFSTERFYIYWNETASRFSNLDIISFDYNSKLLISNSRKKEAKQIIKNILSQLIRPNSFVINDMEITYYHEIISIQNFIKNEKLNIDIYPLLPLVSFGTEDYLKLIKNNPSDYKKYNIIIEQDTLLNVVLGVDIKENQLNREICNKYIEELKILQKDYDFSELIQVVQENILKLNTRNKKHFDEYFAIYDALKQPENNIKLNSSFYRSLRQGDPHFYKIMAIGIANFDNSFYKYEFKQLINNPVSGYSIEELTKETLNYSTYNDLLKIFVNNPDSSEYLLLREIILYIITKNMGKVLDINWILKNYSLIVKSIFGNNNEQEVLFLKNINTWNTSYKKYFKGIDLGILKHFDKQDLKLIQKITKDALNYIENLNKQELLEAFESNNNDFTIIEHLINNKLLTKFSSEFYSAFHDYYETIAKGSHKPNKSDFWNSILDILNIKKIKSTFTTVRDILCNDRGELEDNELLFFQKGLLKYGDLDKTPNKTALKIILPLIKSKKCFDDVFFPNIGFFSKIIHNSKEHKETILNELTVKVKNLYPPTSDILKQYFKLETEEIKNDI